MFAKLWVYQLDMDDSEKAPTNDDHTVQGV